MKDNGSPDVHLTLFVGGSDVFKAAWERSELSHDLKQKKLGPKLGYET